MYYVYIEEWCLRYAWEYLVGGIRLSGSIEEQVRTSAIIFGEATGINADGVFNLSAAFWVLVIALNIALVYRGLKGGIEKFCHFALPAMGILATVQIISFGWIWGIDKGAKELDQGALMRIPRPFFFIMKYIAPAYLLVVLGGFTYCNLGDKATELAGNPIALWTVVITGVVLALLVGPVAIGERRWRAAGMNLDGDQP